MKVLVLLVITFPEAFETSIADNKALVIFVAQDASPVPGAVSCSVAEWKGNKDPAIVIGFPATDGRMLLCFRLQGKAGGKLEWGELYRIALDAGQKAQEIQAAERLTLRGTIAASPLRLSQPAYSPYAPVYWGGVPFHHYYSAADFAAGR